VNCGIFKEMRAAKLPEWLRQECQTDKLTLKQKAAIFPETGFPYRGEHFL
jgi:DNA polymerase III delta subunit